MKRTLVPSYPAPSYEKLLQWAQALTGVTEELQVDLVDGVFAPYTSWPFTVEDTLAELKKLGAITKLYEVEMDCMVQHPENYLPVFTELKISRLIIHLGSTDHFSKIVAYAHKQRWKVGLAFTNDVPLSFIHPYIASVDYVQVMGIAQVGKQGQPFDERTVETVQKLKAAYPDLEIAVDGSVNAETIPQLKKAGVTRFAPGSVISNVSQPQEAYKQLQTLLQS